jgi:hypothetical protein
MKKASLIFFSWSIWASAVSSQLAHQEYQNFEFKKSLSSYKELLKRNPQSTSYAIHVAELTFLIEGRQPALQVLSSF